jgi:hypothetical protein
LLASFFDRCNFTRNIDINRPWAGTTSASLNCVWLEPADLCNVVTRPRASTHHHAHKEQRLDLVALLAPAPIVNPVRPEILEVNQVQAGFLHHLAPRILLEVVVRRICVATDETPLPLVRLASKQQFIRTAMLLVDDGDIHAGNHPRIHIVDAVDDASTEVRRRNYRVSQLRAHLSPRWRHGDRQLYGLMAAGVAPSEAVAPTVERYCTIRGNLANTTIELLAPCLIRAAVEQRYHSELRKQHVDHATTRRIVQRVAPGWASRRHPQEHDHALVARGNNAEQFQVRLVKLMHLEPSNNYPKCRVAIHLLRLLLGLLRQCFIEQLPRTVRPRLQYVQRWSVIHIAAVHRPFGKHGLAFSVVKFSALARQFNVADGVTDLATLRGRVNKNVSDTEAAVHQFCRGLQFHRRATSLIVALAALASDRAEVLDQVQRDT